MSGAEFSPVVPAWDARRIFHTAFQQIKRRARADRSDAGHAGHEAYKKINGQPGASAMELLRVNWKDSRAMAS